jgi:hypothetical protein
VFDADVRAPLETTAVASNPPPVSAVGSENPSYLQVP